MQMAHLCMDLLFQFLLFPEKESSTSEVKQCVANHRNSATSLTQQLVFMALTACVGKGVMMMEAREINGSIKDLWPRFFEKQPPPSI